MNAERAMAFKTDFKQSSMFLEEFADKLGYTDWHNCRTTRIITATGQNNSISTVGKTA
jgi:hypothetical protein